MGPLRPNLGTASTYAIFTGGGAINNTGLSVLTGDVGQDGAHEFNGFPPGTYTGALNRNNGASAIAKSDILTAQTTIAAVTCDFVLGVGIVDGQSFDPAVYCSGGASTTTGNITFDAHGDATAIFIVKIGGALGANSGTHILLANGAQASNIYWFVNGAVDIADNSTFKGTIVANGAISFLGTSTLDGRALAAPAGAINIAANSMGFFGTSSTNIISITHPLQGDTLRGGTVNYQITWTGTGIGSTKTIEYSLDSGLTWRSVGTATGDVFSFNWNVPDTVSKKAKVRITDQNSLRAISGLFMIGSSKIIVVKPALSEKITGGTQNYLITWTGTGLALQKTLEYSLDSGLTWRTIGTVSSDVLTYSWNLPDTASTKAIIRITDQRGITGKSALFTIRSSKIIVVKPAFNEKITGGTQNYMITWTGTGLALQKTFELSIDSGITWTTIGTTSSDISTYSWDVPDIATKKAMVRVTDQNGITGKSAVFTIGSSKITVTRPFAGEIITGGTQNYVITWTGIGLAPQKTVEYSLDSGLTWKTIGTINSDVSSYFWHVPDTASTQAVIRVTDMNGITGKSSIFTIKKSIPAPGNIAIVRPAFGESIVAGTQNYIIMWTGVRITTIKTISLSLDEGLTWSTIGTTSSDGFTYFWNVPDTATSDAIIRIVDENGITGYSGVFNLTRSIPNPGSIVITHPVLNEVLDGGTPNFLITFTSTNTTPVKKFEYSLDGGLNWSLIGFMNSDAQEFIWDVVPNVATTNALVRITDANGVVGVSDLFTINIRPDIGTINSLTLSGLNSKNNIGNNKPLGISWTYTPDIGTYVVVEYTLDFMVTWHQIATVPVSELSSTTWTTPMTGFYNPVFIRVTSSLGMTRTSIAFSIGTTASVSYEASKDGYSVSNYPNPAADMTMLNVTLPITSDVSLTVIDALGRSVASIESRRYDAGNYSIPLNTSALSSGIYSYILRAGSTTLVGKMNIAK